LSAKVVAALTAKNVEPPAKANPAVPAASEIGAPAVKAVAAAVAMAGITCGI
jgi:hypothetical protein